MTRLVWLALFVAACDGSPPRDAETLTVYAASSLTDVFRELAGSFEEAHPGVGVDVSFAGSQILRLQIERGAPADVFASADEEHVELLQAAGEVGDARVFAHNQLVVIVPASSGIERFEELGRAERLVIGEASVPVGRYTRQVLARASDQLGEAFFEEVMDSVVSQESNVRLVRAKVELGEADAAIVYRSDAVSTSGVRIVEIPDASNVSASYHQALVSGSPAPDLGRAWLDHVAGDAGRRALTAHGFVPAP